MSLTEATRLGNLTIDSLGGALAVDGGLVVAGAPWRSSSGGGAQVGGVVIFEGSGYVEVDNPESRAYSYFGTSVAVSGRRVIAGAEEVAYVIEESGESWEVSETLRRDEAEAFGTAVAIDGEVVVVGAHDTTWSRGAAYVYELVESSWDLVASWNGTEYYDYYGYSVAVAGDRVVVGAWGDSQAGSGAGAVFVYTRATWEVAMTLVRPGGERTEEPHFGWSVATRGDLIVAGARDNDDGGPSDTGAVYVFNATNGTLLAEYFGSEYLERLGASVAVSSTGSTVAAGGYDLGYVYYPDGTTQSVDPKTDSDFAVAVADDAFFIGSDGVVAYREPRPSSGSSSSGGGGGGGGGGDDSTSIIIIAVVVAVVLVVVTLLCRLRRRRRSRRVASRAAALKKAGLALVEALFLAGEAVPILGAVCVAARRILQEVIDASNADERAVRAAERVVAILEFLRIISENTKNLKQDDDAKKLVERYMTDLREKIDDFSAVLADDPKRSCCERHLHVYARAADLDKLDADIAACLDNLRLAYQLANDRHIHALLAGTAPPSATRDFDDSPRLIVAEALDDEEATIVTATP